MEWIPKYLDNLDSAVLALYQSWAGYYRWVLLRLMVSIAAVAAMIFSPALRLTAMAVVTACVFMETFGRLMARRRQSRIARV